MRKNEKGFSVVEIILVIIILGLVGVIGWTVYRNRTKTPAATTSEIPAKTSTTATSTTPAAATTDETADWYTYQSSGKEFSIKLPDGWNLQYGSDTKSLYGFTTQSITYTAGTKAAVSEVGARDWGHIPFMLQYYADGKIVFKTNGSIQSTFTTTAGLNVDKYYNLVTADPETMGPGKGTKEYYYEIKKGSTVIVVEHDIAPGETDQTALIEKAVKTIVL